MTTKVTSQISKLANEICQRRINNCTTKKFEFDPEDIDSFLPENNVILKNFNKFSNNDNSIKKRKSNYSTATCTFRSKDNANISHFANGFLYI